MRARTSVLIAAAAALVIAYALYSSGPRVPDSSVLVVELSGELVEAPPLDSLSQLLARGPALPTMILQLDKAAADERIDGLLVHVRPLSIGYAQLQELRDALLRVRERGKPVIALLDVGTMNATRELYLASAADQVYLVPGFLGPLAGISGHFLHLGGLMEKLGIRVEYERSGEYKSAPEMFAAREMSEPARRNATALIDGLFEQIVAGIAEGRGLEPEQVRKLVDEAPTTGAEYVASGLADGIADRSDVLELAGLEGAETVELSLYAQVDPRSLKLRDGPAIAVIFGHGTIVPGQGSRRTAGFAAERIARALETAAKDDDVRAIVLRIDSPGGSPLASDRLWRLIERTKEKLPLVISMGNAAASGGYYVASAATAIVAQPATFTGSIGVFLIRPSYAGLYEKLDIHTEVIQRGALATLSSGDQPLTPAQRARTRSFVRSLYEEFIERVASGRDIAPEEVERLGQGQVWLGHAALENGLVDAVGGLHTAVELAAREAGIDEGVDPERRIFPGPRSLGQQIQDMMRGELRGELRGALLDAFSPLRLPGLLHASVLLLDGEIAYLPSWWLEID